MIASVRGLIIVENEHSVVIYYPNTRESKVFYDADIHVMGKPKDIRFYGLTL